MSKASTLDFEVLKQPSTKSSTNLMTNGSAETNIAGWGSLLSTTLTRDTTEHFFGTASLKVVTPGTANREGAQFTTNTVPNDGNWYAVSMWIKGTAGTPMEYTNTGVRGRLLTGDWVRVVIVMIGAGQIVAARTAAGITAAITFYVDGVQIEKVTNPNFVETPYIDTNGSTASNRLPFGTPSPVLLPSLSTTYTEASTVTMSLSASAAEAAQFADSATVPMTLAPTTTLEGITHSDSGTPQVTVSPTANDSAQFVDSGTASVPLTITAVETFQGVESATATVLVSSSGSDQLTGVDANLPTISLDANATEQAATLDSGTTPIVLTTSADEAYGRILSDTSQASINLNTSAADAAQFADSITALLQLSSSGTEVATALDAALGLLELSASATEVFTTSDAAIILLRLSASGVDVFTLGAIAYYLTKVRFLAQWATIAMYSQFRATISGKVYDVESVRSGASG